MKKPFIRNRLDQLEYNYKVLEQKLKRVGMNQRDSKQLQAKMIRAYEKFADVATRACEQGIL